MVAALSSKELQAAEAGTVEVEKETEEETSETETIEDINVIVTK